LAGGQLKDLVAGQIKTVFVLKNVIKERKWRPTQHINRQTTGNR